jgi:hypothetical protein
MRFPTRVVREVKNPAAEAGSQRAEDNAFHLHLASAFARCSICSRVGSVLLIQSRASLI